MLSSLFALILVSFSQAAPAPSAASQWHNAEETDSYLQAPVCRAFTRAMSGAEGVELSFVFPKDAKLPPLAVIKTKLTPPMAAVKFSASDSASFFLLQSGATNQDTNLYWYAPVNFARLEAFVRDQNALTLVLDPKGAAPTPVNFSLSGSTNALDAARKCAQSAPEPTAFFQLLNAQKDNLTPDLGDRSPAFLFRTVQAAFDAYRAGQGIQQELAALRKANAPLLNKETAALAAVKSSQAAFDSASSKLNAANAQVAALTQQLGDSKAKLAALQAEKPADESDLAQKKAAYLPLKAQMVPYDKAITDGAAQVSALTASIAQNQNTIDRNTQKIPAIQAESAQLQRQLPGLADSKSRAQSRYNEADRNYRSYDVNREYNNELARDSQYTWAKNAYDNAQRDYNSRMIARSQAQSELGHARDALNACHAQHQPNCSNWDSAVNQAQSKFNAALSAENSAQSAMNNARWQMDNRSSAARSKVQGESSRLQSIRSSAESAYNSAANALSQAQDRINEIRNAIPVLQAQIDKARAALPGLRDQLSAAEAALAKAKTDRQAFADSIGFGAAETAYSAADQKLKSVTAAIADLSKTVPQLTKDLAAAQKVIPGLTSAFQAAQTALTKAQATLAPIEEQLKPFRAQETVKLAELNAASDKFKNARAAYQDLRRLLDGQV
ncbi:MAG: hypothetical protein ACXVB9_08910 [Bdellovibrionota bacterium]